MKRLMGFILVISFCMPLGAWSTCGNCHLATQTVQTDCLEESPCPCCANFECDSNNNSHNQQIFTTSLSSGDLKKVKQFERGSLVISLEKLLDPLELKPNRSDPHLRTYIHLSNWQATYSIFII